MKRILILALALAAPAWGEAPETSPRPNLRGGEPAVVAAAAETPNPTRLRPNARPVIEAPITEADEDELARRIALTRLRPHLRPPSEQALGVKALGEAALGDRVAFATIAESTRPWLRPPAIVEKAMAKRRKLRQGMVCGDIEIQGAEVGNVAGKARACGIKDAVRLTSVAGVRFSQQPLMNCRTAKALQKWIKRGVQPAFGGKGPVVELRVAAHYACRSRNNQPGAKISEHGKGNAIDISAFTMRSGEVYTVLEDWSWSEALRKVHRAACGTFGTVLGPGSDGFHRDHIHLDTAAYRSGAYCK